MVCLADAVAGLWLGAGTFLHATARLKCDRAATYALRGRDWCARDRLRSIQMEHLAGPGCHRTLPTVAQAYTSICTFQTLLEKQAFSPGEIASLWHARDQVR